MFQSLNSVNHSYSTILELECAGLNTERLIKETRVKEMIHTIQARLFQLPLSDKQKLYTRFYRLKIWSNFLSEIYLVCTFLHMVITSKF